MRLAKPISSTFLLIVFCHPEEHPDLQSGIATKGCFMAASKMYSRSNSKPYTVTNFEVLSLMRQKVNRGKAFCDDVLKLKHLIIYF